MYRIVGAGVSGLSLAFWLIHEHRVPGDEIVLYEADSTPGGWVKTFRSPSGQMYEQGPRTLRVKGANIREMITALSLDEELLVAGSVGRRFVVLDEVPQEIPSGSSLLRSLLGRRLLWTLLLEPMRALFRPSSEDGESVARFFERVFSQDRVVQRLINAYTSGIWASEADLLSADIVIPELKEIEKKYRSLVLGLLYRALRSWLSPAKQRGESGIFSFRGGLGYYIATLTSWLQKRGVVIQYGVRVDRRASDEAAHWVFACDLLKKDYASVVSISFGWQEVLKPDLFPSFGLLAPKEEDPHVLGIIFDSEIFPEQTTSMATRVSVMVGGTRFPGALALGRETLIELARDRVRRWCGIGQMPSEAHLFSSKDAIPIPRTNVKALPGYLIERGDGFSLSHISSMTAGVSLSDCIAAARKLSGELRKGG